MCFRTVDPARRPLRPTGEASTRGDDIVATRRPCFPVHFFFHWDPGIRLPRFDRRFRLADRWRWR
jgi:hypothetical protein